MVVKRRRRRQQRRWMLHSDYSSHRIVRGAESSRTGISKCFELGFGSVPDAAVRRAVVRCRRACLQHRSDNAKQNSKLVSALPRRASVAKLLLIARCPFPPSPPAHQLMPKKVTPKTRLRDIQRLLDKNTKLPPDVRSKFEAEAKTIEQQLQQVSADSPLVGNHAHLNFKWLMLPADQREGGRGHDFKEVRAPNSHCHCLCEYVSPNSHCLCEYFFFLLMCIRSALANVAHTFVFLTPQHVPHGALFRPQEDFASTAARREGASLRLHST
jgi:hypothetical protein